MRSDVNALIPLGLDRNGPDHVQVPGLPGGWRLHVKIGRGVPYPVQLDGRNYILQLAPESARVRFQARSAWLMQVGPIGVHDELRALHGAFYLTEHAFEATWKIAHLDLTADFVGLSVDSIERERFITRSGVSRFDDDVEDEGAGTTGRTWKTGFAIGSRKSALSAVIYNKCAECKRDPKPWLDAEHVANGWDGVRERTRIEFRLHGRGLETWSQARALVDGSEVDDDAYSLRSLDRALLSFSEWAPEVWRYATDDWLRYVTPDQCDRNRWRWEVDARWRAVQRLGAVGTITRAKDVRAARLDEVERRASAKIFEGAFSITALRLANKDVELPENDAELGAFAYAHAMALLRRSMRRGAVRHGRRRGAYDLVGAFGAIGQRMRARVEHYRAT